MSTKIEIVNAPQVIQGIQLRTKVYQLGIEKAMARWMTEVRQAAANEEILPNTTKSKGGGKIYNPYIASREQKSTPGRLTSRTGKLAYMLRGGREGRKYDYMTTWQGMSKPLGMKRERTSGLKGLVRVMGSKYAYAYQGTYRVDIAMDSVLSNTGTKRGTGHMPTETRQRLFMRFKHETGLKGGVRPFMAPAANKRQQILNNYLQEAINNAFKL